MKAIAIGVALFVLLPIGRLSFAVTSALYRAIMVLMREAR